MPTIARSQAHLLPQDNDAERAVLGSLLIDPDAMLRVREVTLEPRDFYQETHGLIYRAMLDLADRWQPVDAVTLAAALDSKQNGHGSQLALIGGPAYLTGLIETTPTSVHAATYAGVVKALAQRRRIISVAADIAAQAQEHDGPIDALYSSVTAAMLGVVDVAGPHSHLYGTDDTLLGYLTTQSAREELLKRNPNALAQTGIPDLDALLGNLEPGTVLAIAARPGVGKTILMEQVAEHNARHGKRVAFYHLELSHQFMLDRRMAKHSGIPLDRLRRGYNGPEVGRAIDAMHGWQSNLVYIHCPGWSAERIAADMTRLAARGECDVAIVDYLQKLALPDKRGWNTAMLYGLMAEALKTAAEQLAIPLVLGTQVSRDWKQTGDKRPTAGDIRNSGEIEEKVNQIVVLHRPETREGQKGATTETIEAHVEKNTGGPLGSCELVHLPGRFTFAGRAQEETDSDIDY